MTYFPANARYEKKNILAVHVKFNRATEPDLVERIMREDKKATYLKRLVREDIDRERQRDKRDATGGE